jgi:hypothetical protein
MLGGPFYAKETMTKRELNEGDFKKRWCSGNWALCAENLWRAADILFSAYQESTAENGEPLHWENTELHIPATLLYAYAMENAIKGLLVRKLKLNRSGCEKVQGWRQHDLAALFDQTKDQIAIEEYRKEYRLLLVTLTAHIVWAGRYPSPFKLTDGDRGFVLSRQWQQENGNPIVDLPPTTVNILSREKLKELFRLMIDEI